MSWREIIGHHDVVERLQRAIIRQRLTGSYLFVGPPGVGKRTVAIKAAQALLCMARAEGSAEPCLGCRSCHQVQAGSHPDLDILQRPADRTFLPIELFVGDRQHRNQEGLCHRIALTPYQSKYRVAIIDDADDLSIEGANVLLKTLEEPPPYAVLILIATSVVRQLPTVRSRCQIVSFMPLEERQVEQILASRLATDDNLRKELEASQLSLATLASLSRGSVQTALEWVDRDLVAMRRSLLRDLSQSDWDPFATARQLQQYLDGVSKDSIRKRRALRQIIAAVADFYRHILRLLGQQDPLGDEELRSQAYEAVQTGRFDWKTIALCMDACLQADQAAAANAHLPTLIDAWLDQLAEAMAVAQGRHPRG